MTPDSRACATLCNVVGKAALLVLGALLWALTARGAVTNLGRFGAVYPVAEPDALEEIVQAASRIDWAAFFDPQKMSEKIRSWKPADLRKLPRAEEERVRLVDLSWTLPFDIPRVNEKGEVVGILYPRGYTFNPLDYVSYPRTLVVIDGTDPLQVGWFEKSRYADDPQVVLLVTDGSWYELWERLKRPVFYALGLVIDRLKIEKVPSVVRQKGRYMEVKEVAVEAELKQRPVPSPGASAPAAVERSRGSVQR